MGSIYHLRTEEQYLRGLPHESTVQGTYMSLARWNSTPNKYLPLRVIRSLIQASFLHFGDCTQRYPLKGCGAVWRPAGCGRLSHGCVGIYCERLRPARCALSIFYVTGRIRLCLSEGQSCYADSSIVERAHRRSRFCG